MRLGWMMTAVAAATLAAGDLDPRLLCLIPPDARMVNGVELGRFKGTALADMLHLFDAAEPVEMSLVIEVEGNPGGERVTLSRASSVPERQCAEDGISYIAQQVRRLATEYDAWFVAIKPLELTHPSADAKLAQELVQTLEEVRGGVRAGGAYHEFHVEATMRTSEDAATLAGIGRWLPGFFQLQNSRTEGKVWNLAHNLDVRAEGRIASLTFSISDRELRELIESERVKTDER